MSKKQKQSFNHGSEFLLLPGMAWETERFKRLLQISGPLDHILIRGPRGVGKRYFRQVFEDQTDQKPIVVNCAAIHPEAVVSELFGHKKGAFTGADQNKDGFIKTAAKEGKPLFLEELNSLDKAHQAKLLVFMEEFEFYPMGATKAERAEVRILAAVNDEPNTGARADVLDRFKINVAIPPLYKRRGDILEYIAQKYSDVVMSKTELIALYAHDWPGNLRELDRVLSELKAGLTLQEEILLNAEKGLNLIRLALHKRGITKERIRSLSSALFSDLIPFHFDDFEWRFDSRRFCDSESLRERGESVSVVKRDKYLLIKAPGPVIGSPRLIPIKSFKRFFDLLHSMTINKAVFLLNPDNFKPFPHFKTQDPIRHELEEIFLDVIREAFLEHEGADTPPSGISPDQVIEFVLKLGSFDAVKRFLYKGCRPRFGHDKDLAQHWEMSQSTLGGWKKNYKN